MLRAAVVVVAGLAVLACRPDIGSTGHSAASAPTPPPEPQEPTRSEPAEEPARSDAAGAGWLALPAEVRRRVLEDYLRGAEREAAGFAECPDYLTRIESDNFCSAELPPDWNAFEFDGETYFVQPLARAGD